MSTNVYYHRSSSAVHLQALTCGRWTLLHSHHENHILLLPLETVREIDKEYSRWDPLTSLSRLIKKYGFYSHNIWKELWEFVSLIFVFYILQEVKGQRSKVTCLQSHSQNTSAEAVIPPLHPVVRLSIKFVHCCKMLLTWSPLAWPLLEPCSSPATPSHSCLRVCEPVVQGSVCFWPVSRSLTSRCLHAASSLSSFLQTRQPVFVQLLQGVFRVYHCNWLVPSQKASVESCIRVLSDVGKTPPWSGFHMVETGHPAAIKATLDRAPAPQLCGAPSHQRPQTQGWNPNLLDS